jgi:hypothetical protein
MPDYLDPVGLSDDIIIYFDDIILNNDSMPIKARQVDFHVDMRNVPHMRANRFIFPALLVEFMASGICRAPMKTIACLTLTTIPFTQSA